MNNTLITVLGGIDVEVTKQDGSTESVKIRQLRLRDAARYLALAQSNDEERLVEFFCGKEKGWTDTLIPESAEAALMEGEKLNQDFMMRCATRARSRQEMIAPGFEEKALKALIEKLGPSLPASLPKPDLASSNSPIVPLARSVS